MLNKLQQDAGAKFFNDIGNGKESSEPCSADIDHHRAFIAEEVLPTASDIADNFEEIPPQRLQIFSMIRGFIAHNEPFAEAYGEFVSRLETLVAPAPMRQVGIQRTGQDFLP